MAKSNVTAVQVPGEQPVIAQEAQQTEQNSEQERSGIEQSSVASESATNEVRPTGRAAYRNTRAADIDPTTLTAPVLTLDGWLCPPATVKK